MAKQIKYGQDARHALESGINQLQELKEKNIAVCCFLS